MNTRCCECRKPVDLRDRSLVVKEGPAGLNMNRIHRTVKNYWHAECWNAAESFAANSRAAYEAQRIQTMRQLCLDNGLNPADFGLPTE